MKKAFKVVLVLSAIALTAVIAVFAAYLAITKDAKLDESKLTDYGRCITVCDKDGKEITNASLSAKPQRLHRERLYSLGGQNVL